ncbi:hypothetical protein Bsel_1746 [[Bacillus] selenitireducens MLS10]|uniref:Magnesium transporter MgtE intracellular domain-containing protein n=2 Tax=Salisediminibacterium selenitireducens TaxID=85683 RepID=D6XTW8_BACIE|nr:hypothetical protein Bsel_1746 [[Bacillus] selenitireducens MLS10]
MKSGEAMSKQNKKKSEGKLQVFFMVVLIPAVFAIILAAVVLYYLGFNIGDQMRNIAGVLPFIESEEVMEGEEELTTEEYIAQLERENQTLTRDTEDLQRQVESQEEEILQLEEELLLLQSDGTLEDGEMEGDTVEASADLNDIVRTLQEMTASRAADIMEELPQDQAVTYLQLMNNRARADILSRMEAETAAVLISQLSE